MDISILNESPDSIILHEVFVDEFSINKDEIIFRLRLHHSIYLWHENVLKDIYKDPNKSVKVSMEKEHQF